MPTFEELVDTVDNLSKDQLAEMKKIIERKWQSLREDEITRAVAEARQESKDGKTIIFSSPEEIESYFQKMKKDDH